MDRILYITYVDYKANAFPGVLTKIEGHIRAMRRKDCCVDRINQYGKAAQLVFENGAVVSFSGVLRRFSIYLAVKSAVKKNKYCGAYIRFQFFSEDVRLITRLLQNEGIRVAMELPTYPYEGELYHQGWKGLVKLLCDKAYRIPCSKGIDVFVTQSDEKYINKVPCLKVLNGLDYSKHPLRNVKSASEKEVHLLAVASMLPWHGYDRLINGLVNYYQINNSEIQVYVHLVGEGRELNVYKRIVAENGLKDKVFFYGMQSGTKLNCIANQCDIAVGSLAAFRIGLNSLSTLKSREYCAWGFPTINATPTDILDVDDPYCMYIPADESPVDIYEVISFYRRVYLDNEMDEICVARAIRHRGKMRSDVHSAFQPVIQFLKEGYKGD